MTACSDILQPPPAPRLGPRPSPFPIDAVPFLELPAAAVDLCRVATRSSRSRAPSGGDGLPHAPPRAPRLGPSPSPVFDEPMPELRLPEAETDPGSFSFHLPADMDLGWRSEDSSDQNISDDDHVFMCRTFSAASTIVPADNSACPSPAHSDYSKYSLSSTQGKQQPNKFAGATTFQALQAFNVGYWEAAVTLA